jgi:tRNA pseudouridine65 synthase
MASPLELLWADEHLAVVHKPSGLLVHRGWGDDDVVAMTEARSLLGRWVYPVHRLDRGTSGALLFALSPEVARKLQEAFEARAVTKVYWALVRGALGAELLIDHPVPRAEDGPKVEAITAIAPLWSKDRYSWVEARPRTGRLHQIRRHLKHVSHPIIGDVNYGKGEHNRLFRERYGLHRLALHAARIELEHPVTAERIRVDAPLPQDLAEPLARWAPDGPWAS